MNGRTCEDASECQFNGGCMYDCQNGRQAPEAPSGYLPTDPAFLKRHGAILQAVGAFLTATDRKLDDGDALQGWADAKAVLSGLLEMDDGQRLARIEAAFALRRVRARGIGDVRAVGAAESALSLIRSTK